MIDLWYLTSVSLQGQFDIARPHSVTVFDVGTDGLLTNRRLFASVAVYDGSGPGLGIPDGIKVDTAERVYIGTVDGVQGQGSVLTRHSSGRVSKERVVLAQVSLHHILSPF